MTGFNDVPSISTTARGLFTANVTAESISYRLTYEGIEGGTVFADTFTLGQVGVNGDVSAFLCGGGDKPDCPATAGTVTGVIDPGDVIGPTAQGITTGEFAEARRALLRGFVYGNVHSTKFPGGEIRGQLARRRGN